MSRSSLAATAAIATLLAGAAIGAQEQAPPPRFGERVDVARIIVDARVLDDRGNPVPGLTADDFKVSIDGKAARVETATWVGGRDTDLDIAPLESTPVRDAGAPTAPGRLIVFLFQKDYEPSRIFGLMNMLLKPSRDRDRAHAQGTGDSRAGRRGGHADRCGTPIRSRRAHKTAGRRVA